MYKFLEKACAILQSLHLNKKLKLAIFLREAP